MRAPTSLFAAALFVCGLAVAQTQSTKIYDDSPGRSARPRLTTASSQLSYLKKRYAEFTAVEKEQFHSLYENIAEGDEPPYPIEGLEPIIRQISTRLAGKVADGEYQIILRVSADGEVKSVRLLKQPSVEDAKLIAYFLVSTKYKSALCKGTPCTMDFLFITDFTNSNY